MCFLVESEALRNRAAAEWTPALRASARAEGGYEGDVDDAKLESMEICESPRVERRDFLRFAEGGGPNDEVEF